MREHLFASVALSLAIFVGGCGSPQTGTSTSTPAPTGAHGRHHHRHRQGYAAATQAAQNTGGAYPCDNAGFLADQSQFANGSLQGDQEVDVCGTVTSVLAERDTRSGLHGYFDLQVAPGSVIEIVSDLGEMNAPAWPWVRTGDHAYVQGRYYYDSPSSQGIDWTHHGTSRSWPTAGYVVVAGTKYQ
jgi:hypothetical protein